MKWWFSIEYLLIGLVMMVASCETSTTSPRPSPEGEGIASLMLENIDSLMWRQPDSALAQLQRFVASPAADSLDAFNGHYCQLLISELLYKNDWGQSNRGELLKAVEFFDSIVDLHGADIQKRNAFLDARGHYINGVGFYEQGDVVNACAEYLKTLEVMEAHFEEKELVEHKARFLVYSYNRLGDLFSEQFMMESAITCYENALVYCKIYPTSSTGVSNILYRIGKQYDKNNEIENASLYYGQAIENMTATDNMVYRDIVASKALCDYKTGATTESFLDELYLVLKCSDTEKERLNRYLTIGGVFFYEGNYDSALFYLEPVFEDNEAGLQAQAAGYLRIIYDSIGNKERSDAYMRFLTNNKKPEGENKALVSKLEDMYKNYSNQKLEKQAKAEQKTAEKRVMNTIIPIAVAIALIIICVLIWRSRRLLKNQQEESNRELKDRDKRHAEAIEAERQTHRMEQAAIAGRLKRSNQELRELKGQIKHLDDLAAKTEAAASFNEEPICRLIMERVNEGQFKAKIDCELYKSYALDKQQLLDLRVAADLHFSKLTLRLRKTYPKLTNIDIDYCCLYLLNLTHADVSALMQRAYNTVVERDSKIQKILGSEKPLPVILMDIAHNPSST